MIEGIDHVGIYVDDLDAAIEFYQRHLGFKLGARYQIGGLLKELAYLELGGLKLELMVLSEATTPTGIGEIAFRVKDFEGEVERLRKEGLELAQPPRLSIREDVPPPYQKFKRAGFKGPNGIIIELREWLSMGAPGTSP